MFGRDLGGLGAGEAVAGAPGFNAELGSSLLRLGVDGPATAFSFVGTRRGFRGDTGASLVLFSKGHGKHTTGHTKS